MASSEDSLPALKILIVGPSGAGKSALLLRYCGDHFDPESATTTIGIDFMSKKLAVRGTAYKLHIFDTAGQERFRSLSTSYYRHAHGVILVYDITNKKSFESMGRWLDEARSNTHPDVVFYLEDKVGSKLDKVATAGRAVSFEEAKAYADAQGALFCEISSKTRENIKRPFVEIVDQIVQKPHLIEGARSNSSKPINYDIGGFPSNPCSC